MRLVGLVRLVRNYPPYPPDPPDTPYPHYPVRHTPSGRVYKVNGSRKMLNSSLGDDHANPIEVVTW